MRLILGGGGRRDRRRHRANRVLALAAGLALLAACDGGGTPDPVPNPSPTRAPTASGESTVPSTEPPCPPLPEFLERTVTIPLRDATPLPDGGRIRLTEVVPATGTAASVVLEVTRATPGCREDGVELDLPEAGGATLLGIKIDVISVNPSKGGMPPSVQLRIGPLD